MGLEDVSSAVLGAQKVRSFRIGFDLLPQPSDTDVHTARCDKTVGTPHRVKKFLSRKHVAGTGGQEKKKLELQGTQRYTLAKSTNTMRIGINHEFVIF